LNSRPPVSTCKLTMSRTLLFGGTAALFLVMTSAALLHLQWAKRLSALSELGPANPHSDANHERVQCSVIIAARDEESRIEDKIRRLLAQLGVQLEVIVVDNRSADRTGEILTRLTQRDDRVRTQCVQEIKFIPRPVIVGFTNGIAVFIASTQLKDFFGLTIDKMPGKFVGRVETLATLPSV
jgi:cellulose synthase/poly-beta-1,6-N-acetylglucosamine synthase-like glycosyltransferase